MEYGRVSRVDLLEKFIHNILLGFKGKKILDVGCGLGSLAILFKKKNPDAEVVGVDINEDYIRIARQRAREAGADVKFHVQDVCKLNKLGEFDLIVSKSSFCYWSKPHDALKAIDRNLAEDGRVVIMDALNDSLIVRILLKSGIIGKFFDIEKGGFPDYVSRCYTFPWVKEFFKGGKIRKKFFGVYFLAELKKGELEDLIYKNPRAK